MQHLDVDSVALALALLPERQRAWLLTVVARPGRVVDIKSRWSNDSTSTDALQDLPGVQLTNATIQGVRYTVYVLRVNQKFVEPSEHESHDLVYRQP